MKKIIIILSFVLLLFSCDKENATENTEISNTVEKHLITIAEIKNIVAGQKFKSFIAKFENNPIYKQNLNNVSEDLSVIEFKEYQDKNNETAFYMTKLSNDKFVLFAADDRSHAIMGITDTGETLASVEDIPDEFKYWLDEEIEAIEFARENYLS
jgi:hypothetical protein